MKLIIVQIVAGKLHKLAVDPVNETFPKYGVATLSVA